MNCKQGDLAVVVRDYGSIRPGLIVTCIKFHPQAVVGGPDGKIGRSFNLWETDAPEMPPWHGVPVGLPDSHLRPIRDTDGDDETLTWAGKPSTINQPTPTRENA